MKKCTTLLSKLLLAITCLLYNSASYGQSGKDLKTKKVLFVVTNVNVAPSNGAAIGLWLEEFATPYYTLKDAGIQVAISSPNGGVSPVDLRSSSEMASNDHTKRFLTDTAAQRALYHTIPLKNVVAENYDGIFYPGGRGPMWDIPENRYSINILETMYAAGKPLAFVCHGPVALKNVKDKDGRLIIQGKKISGYTNEEEQAGNTGDGVPYSLEDMLVKLGAGYQKGEKFKPFVLKDGTIISGQNPHSSLKVAEELILALSSGK